MRSHNLALLLHLAWSEREVSRIDLVRRTGLAPSTVSKLVAELIEGGLLYESHAAPTGGGRPPIVLRFADDRNHLLGVDLGATHVSVALTNLRGAVRGWRTARHPVREDPEGSLALALALARELVGAAEGGLGAVIGLGVSVPSPVDPSAPDTLSRPILPAWHGVHPGARLGGALGLPVWVDNDANLGALAEAWHGAGRGARSLAFLKLGTGIGAGLVVDGEILRGHSGFAGEIAHTSLDPNGPACVCGLRGCLQVLAGAGATVRRAERLLAEGRPSALRPGAHLGEIAHAAAAGDAVALEAVGHSAAWLARSMANLFNLVNPALIVVGGALTEAGPVLLEPLRDAIGARAAWAGVEPAEVVITSFGDQVAALGAATLVLRAALEDPTLVTARPPLAIPEPA